MRLHVKLTAILGALLLLASACTPAEDDDLVEEVDEAPVAEEDGEEPEDEAVDPPEASEEDRTLVVAVDDLGGENFDPHRTTSGLEQPVYDTIFDYVFALDEEGDDIDLSRSIVESYEISDDGLTWTLTVPSDVTFHDGSPLTAEDLAFTFERQIGPDATSLRSGILTQTIDQVEVIDERTVELHLHEPTVVLVSSVSEWESVGTYVVPKAYIEEVGEEEFARNPIGSGPYRFDGGTQGESYRLVAYEDYWGADTGQPLWDAIDIQIVPEEATRANLLRTGDVDVAEVGRELASTLAGEGVNITEKPGALVSALRLRGQSNPDSPLSDQRVREAIALAIDQQSIIDNLYVGFATPATTYTMGSWAVGYPDDLEPSPYDPDRSRELLEEAGYGDGFTLQALVHPNYAIGEAVEVTEAIYAMLAQVGIEVERTQLPDYAAYVDYYYAAEPTDEMINYDAVNNRLIMTGIYFLLSHSTGQGASFVDPELDRMLDELAEAPDMETYETLVAEAARYMADNVYDVPIAEVSATVAYTDSGKVCEWSEGQSFWSPRLRYVAPC